MKTEAAEKEFTLLFDPKSKRVGCVEMKLFLVGIRNYLTILLAVIFCIWLILAMWDFTQMQMDRLSEREKTLWFSHDWFTTPAKNLYAKLKGEELIHQSGDPHIKHLVREVTVGTTTYWTVLESYDDRDSTTNEKGTGHGNQR